MINLLPPELKQDYSYARKNRQLVNWLLAFGFGLVGLAIITSSALVATDNTMSTYQSRIATAQSQLASQDVSGTEQQVAAISSNLKLMVTVLSQEILFSKLLTQLGAITPPNVILTNLSISQSQTAIDITAESGNYNTATQLQINLADPHNQIFSKADIVNIACVAPSKATDPKYPCTADIRAQFTTNNPFLFINSSGQKVSSK